LKLHDVTAVTNVATKNNDVRNSAHRAAVSKPPTRPTEPGLYYATRELNRWYAKQCDRNTGLDQDPLARALVQRLTAPGLSPYEIRDLATWYAEEANRQRVGSVIDQPALDRDLRRMLAERGVFPEFIAAEFERVMQAVFLI
jgi:hypothetical protein